MAKALARASGHSENRLTAHWTGTKRAPKVEPAPVPVELKSHRVLARVGEYQDLWSALRDRVNAMGLSREEFDHVSGLQPGYSGKLFGAKQVKRFGKISLGLSLGAAGCYLILVEDPVQTARILARAKKRIRALRADSANAR